MTLHTVGLVACGKAKLDHSAPARDLYTGSLFRAASAYAEATYDEWFILSALLNLVEPDAVIQPYDRTMSDWDQRGRDRWGSMTAQSLQRRLRGRGLSVPTVPRGLPWPHDPQVAIYLHAGRDYVRPLWFHLGLFPAEVSLPVEGLRIGQQLRWYAERRAA